MTNPQLLDSNYSSRFLVEAFPSPQLSVKVLSNFLNYLDDSLELPQPALEDPSTIRATNDRQLFAVDVLQVNSVSQLPAHLALLF